MRIERKISVSESIDAEQQAKLLEIADKTPVTKALAPGVPIQTVFEAGLDPTGALKLHRLEGEPHHRVFDSMPVVHPGSLDDVVVFFLADFPPPVVRLVDDKLLDVFLTPQPFGKNHSALQYRS